MVYACIYMLHAKWKEVFIRERFPIFLLNFI